MNKFSLIDLFSKIASNKEAVTTITNVISNLVEKGTSNNKNTVAKNIPTQKKDNVHSKTAIISLMEKLLVCGILMVRALYSWRYIEKARKHTNGSDTAEKIGNK